MSIGLTRLFWQLREIGLVGSGAGSVDVIVTLMDEDGLEYGLEAATRCRAAGLNTETVLEPSKLGKQLKYADRSGIRYAVIAGSNERDNRTVTIKDLETQSQVEIPIDEIESRLGPTQES